WKRRNRSSCTSAFIAFLRRPARGRGGGVALWIARWPDGGRTSITLPERRRSRCTILLPSATTCCHERWDGDCRSERARGGHRRPASVAAVAVEPVALVE